MPADQPERLVRVEGLRKVFAPGREPVVAVDNVTFEIFRGETLGLVGETGSGKTTIARMIAGLEEPNDGQIRFGTVDLAQSRSWKDRSLRRRVQMVFQNPLMSLNPRATVGRTLERVLEIHGLANGDGVRQRVAELLRIVGLRSELARRYPHQLSGGQLQRIGLARAIALEPEIIVLDEPTSALDVSIQAQILQLLYRLQIEQNLTYLFISHDLSVVRYLSARMAVLYRGQIMEVGKSDEIIRFPRHPYTRHLISSMPRFYGARSVRTPSATPLPGDAAGCSFFSRCSNRLDRCQVQRPPLVTEDWHWQVACFNPIREDVEVG